MPLLLYIFDKLCDQDTFLVKFSPVIQQVFILIEKTNLNIVLFTIKLGFYKTALSLNESIEWKYFNSVRKCNDPFNQPMNIAVRKTDVTRGFWAVSPVGVIWSFNLTLHNLRFDTLASFY